MEATLPVTSGEHHSLTLQEWEMILFGDGGSGSGNGNITTTRCTTTRSRVGAN